MQLRGVVVYLLKGARKGSPGIPEGIPVTTVKCSMSLIPIPTIFLSRVPTYNLINCKLAAISNLLTRFIYTAYSTKFGGQGRSRTNIVYPMGPDLQSGDAHAVASTCPNLAPSVGISPHSWLANVTCEPTVLPLRRQTWRILVESNHSNQVLQACA
jgi:hypothetical protein